MKDTTNQTPPIKFLTVGNALTIARLVLLPIIIAGISMKIGYLAAVGMGAALLTDLLDGRVSRKMGTASEFGRNLDSTIDFVLLHSLYIAFFAAGRIAAWQFAVIYAVMLATLTLQLLTSTISEQKGVIKTKWGKPAGALEYTILLFLVLREVVSSAYLDIALTGVFTVLAALAALYIIECVARIRGLARAQRK